MRPSGQWAVSATLWRWKSRPPESRSAHWSREVFGPTGHGAQFRMRRTCRRSMRPRSVRSLKVLRGLEGRWESDPRKIADVILQLAHRVEVPVRLILGVDAEKRVQQAEAARAAEADTWRHLTVSTVFEDGRSEERRVGKECRSRWSPY